MTLQEELALLETQYQAMLTGGSEGVVEWREGSKSMRFSEARTKELRERIDRLRSRLARQAIGGSITVDPVRG
jgi:hypothetical protein